VVLPAEIFDDIADVLGSYISNLSSVVVWVLPGQGAMAKTVSHTLATHHTSRYARRHVNSCLNASQLYWATSQRLQMVSADMTKVYLQKHDGLRLEI
jgi:hypothetical protein